MRSPGAALAAALVLLSLASCERKRESEQPKAPPADTRSERPNLLAFTRGAAIVSRTGEATLNSSAVKAIDTDPATRWVSPPRDLQQAAVVSLPTATRIDEIGFRTGYRKGAVATRVSAEFSRDGSTFSPPQQFQLKAGAGTQFFRVSDVVAQYVRVSMLASDGQFGILSSIEVRGAFSEPYRQPRIDGCWTINTLPASFTTNGASTSGFLGGSEKATLAGGSDHGMHRFAWIRGPEYGLAAVTISADGRHLSGVTWHEQAIQATPFMGRDWFGDPAPGNCGASGDPLEVAREYLRRLGYFPLYGLRFDARGNLDVAASGAALDLAVALVGGAGQTPVRFVAHELRQENPAANARMSQQQIDSLRSALTARGVAAGTVGYVAAGDGQTRKDAAVDLTRTMYSRVEIQIGRR